MDEQRRLPTRPKPKEEGCKIRIKNTKGGKEISFHGKCSRQELSLAKGNVEDAFEEGD
jgi:hypothetical protein